MFFNRDRGRVAPGEVLYCLVKFGFKVGLLLPKSFKNLEQFAVAHLILHYLVNFIEFDIAVFSKRQRL